jgi:TP901 family phage tail tape measure protein
MAKKDLILIVGVDDKGTPVIKRMSRDVRGELQRLDKGARKSGKGFDKLKKDVDDSGKGLSKFKGIIKSTMMQMAAGMGIMMGVQGAVRGIKNVVTDFVKTGREFEKSWANVTTMLSISEKETLKMKNQLIGLSPTLGSVTKMAEGMYQVLSASIEPAKAIEFLGTAAKAAVAGVTDVFTAVDALTTVINAYGMAAEDATAVSDIMFQTVKRGKLTFGELASALGTVVPTAAQLGIRFEEIAAGMATLTRQGINVNTVTMQLRQVMMSVLKPTTEAKVLAKDLGIEFTATALKAKGLSNFLAEITEKTKGNVTIMGEFFSNIRALSAVFGLAGKSAADFAYDISLMEDSVGSTEVAFQKQMKTLDFWIKTATNALEDMKVAFYEGMVDPIRMAISSQEDLDKVFKSMTGTAGTAGKTVGSIIKLFKVLQPMIDQWLTTIANAETGFARIIQFITMGYIPAYDKLVQKQWEAIVTSARLADDQKDLAEGYGGVWGMIAKGAGWWKRQIDFYIDSGLSVEEYLKKLDKLRKGQAGYQKQEKTLQSILDLGLKTKNKLNLELSVLTKNIEEAAGSGLVFTGSLGNSIKRAMILAEVTNTQLSPAIKALIKELDLVKEKAVKYLDTINGVRTGTEWWNYDSVNMKTILQGIRSELNSASFAWAKVTLKMRESSDFMKKYALSLPPPMTELPLTGLEKFASKFQEVMAQVQYYGSLVTTQWDAMWSQMYTNQIQRIDNEYQARKQAIDDSMKTDQEKYFAIEKLDREMQKKRLDAQRKHAKASKVTSLFGAIVNTAEAVAKALTAGPFLGPILAAVIGAMGAVQVALIAAQPLPSFAEGGIALTPQVATVAERGPEAIAPLGDLISIIREVIREEFGAGATTRESQKFYLHQDVYIAGDKVEEKVTEMVMHKAEVGDLTFPAKAIR